jgi:nucleoside-diphosphate-sugar epimerase
MITINGLAEMAIGLSGKKIRINNLEGQAFKDKYGFKCPIGVMGRNSNNRLYAEKMGWEVSQPLADGMRKTYEWIATQVNKAH